MPLNISNGQIVWIYESVMVGLGMFRLSFFINIFKKSGSEKIPVDQIKGINESTFLGRKDIL
jgi:hypothetical protein